MATPKKKYPYAIYYNDGSYMIYDLTQEDFDQLKGAIVMQAPVAVELSVGLITVTDIRSVIKQTPPPKPKKNEGSTPDLTAEEIEWMSVTKAQWREDEGGYDQ